MNKPYYGTLPTLSPDLVSNQLKHLVSKFICQPSDPYIFCQVVWYTPRVNLIFKAIYDNGPSSVQNLPITYPILHHLFAPLLINHISFGMIKGLNFMSLTIHRSKTKPHGFQIRIGCSGTPTCALCSMHSCLHYHTSLSPIPPNSYLFVLANGSPLLRSVLNHKIKCLVSSIDLESPPDIPHIQCAQEKLPQQPLLDLMKFK